MGQCRCARRPALRLPRKGGREVIKLRNHLTFEEVDALLIYNPVTGVFTHRATGNKAGNPQKHAYNLFIKGEIYGAHRVAWLLYYKEWPKLYIDHINGNPHDNRIINLRLATPRENQQNQKRHRNGWLCGTGRCYRCNSWYARIRINGVQVRLGTYPTQEAAHEAYLKALSQIRSATT